MESIRLVAYVTLTVVALAAIPVVYVLAREAWRRRRARRQEQQEQAAFESMVRFTAGQDAEALRARFDFPTLERALWRVLRSGTTAEASRLAASLGLTERFLQAVRHAPAWGDRAHAAEMLGLLGDPRACAPLVETLRDPYEDVTVKRAASDALARLRDPGVMEELVSQLLSAGDLESPRLAELLVAFGESCTQLLVSRALRADSPQCRTWAARVLGRVGARDAVEPLLACFDDTYESVRAAAAEALGHIRAGRAVDRLVDVAQKDPSARVRAEAARALGNIGDPAAFDSLRAALQDADHATRLRALEALALIEPDRIEPLERLLRDVNPAVRRRAALALDRIGFVDSCVRSLAADDERVSSTAREALRSMSLAGMNESLLARALECPPPVRASLVEIVAGSGDPEAGRRLLGYTDDEDPSVRAAAVAGLASCGTEEAVDRLVDLLGDPQPPVSIGAAAALASLPPATVAERAGTLRDVYLRSAAPCRQHLLSILAASEDVACQDLVVHAAEDPDEAVRTTAVSLLPGLPQSVSIRPLMDRMHDPSPVIRLAAIDALGALRHEQAREVLFDQLSEADEAAREHISGSLARFGVQALAPQLDAVVRGGTTSERLGAAWALGKTGDPDSLPFLERLVRDDEPRVRASAAGALGKVPCAQAADLLAASAADPDPRTRAAIVNALGKLRSSTGATRAAVRGRLADPDPFVRNRAVIALAMIEPEALAALPAETERTLDRASLTIALAAAGTKEGAGRAGINLGDDAFRATVLGAVRREPEHVREAFARTLRLGGAADVASGGSAAALVRQQQRFLQCSTDVPARKAAVAFLAGLAVPDALAVLADVLASDPSAAVRAQAADALGTSDGSETVRQGLVSALVDPAPPVSCAAARAIGTHGDVSLLDALLERLSGAPAQLAEAIEDALVELLQGDPFALSARLLTTSDRSVAVAGLRVLERIGSVDLMPAVRTLLRSPDPEIRVEALRAACALGADAFDTEIAGALGAPDPGLRQAVVEMLAGRAQRFLPHLGERAVDPAPAVRRALARLVAELDERASADIVEALLADPVADVRAAVLVSLLDRGTDDDLTLFQEAYRRAPQPVTDAVGRDPRSERVAEKLVRQLSWHPNPGVRFATVVGLRALAPADLERHLLGAILDPSAHVRAMVVRALAPSQDPQVRQRLREALDDPSEVVRDEARRANVRLVHSSGW